MLLLEKNQVHIPCVKGDINLIYLLQAYRGLKACTSFLGYVTFSVHANNVRDFPKFSFNPPVTPSFRSVRLSAKVLNQISTYLQLEL
jgi:hypothetical protein